MSYLLIFVPKGEMTPEPYDDLGKIAEDSINRDPEGFVKNVKDRAGKASPLQRAEAADLTVQQVDLVGGDFPQPEPIMIPPPQPTAEDDTTYILMTSIIVTVGVVVILGAYLFLRKGLTNSANGANEAMEGGGSAAMQNS